MLFLRNIVLLGWAALVAGAGAGSLSLDAAMESRRLGADTAT